VKKANSKIGYAIGTVFAGAIVVIVSLAVIGLVSIGVLRIWMYFIDLMQAII